MMSVLIFLLGLVIGSFLNVVIIRLVKNESIIWPASRCPDCQTQLAFFENIPLISFLFLKGKCRHCKNPISIQYFLVELICGLIFLIIYDKFGPSFLAFKFFVFSCFLLVIFTIDFKHYLILDSVTIPALIISIILNMILKVSLREMVLGALICGGFFLIQYLVSKGVWIGDGDIRLGALMGVMLGFRLSLVALFLAYLLGALVGIFLIIYKNKKLQTKIPFGTFLSLSTFISILYGEKILSWYLKLINY